MAEWVWMLASCYGNTRNEICTILETLLRIKELVVADGEICSGFFAPSWRHVISADMLRRCRCSGSLL
jgi:hypothetical protein